MSLAIFDLDNTLIAGDSDYSWGEFLVAKALVDVDHYRQQNQRFYEDYQAGTLDIFAYQAFSLEPLAALKPAQLEALRDEFMATVIEPMVLPKALECVQKHRELGHTLMIITATNRFVTERIAERYGIKHLLATEGEYVNGRFTGKVAGTPCFQEGKIQRLTQWLDEHKTGRQALDDQDITFYSDSHNDLPLLSLAQTPIAVDPDDKLTKHAQEKQWQILSFRNT